LSDVRLLSYWAKSARHDFEVALNGLDTEYFTQVNKSLSNKATYNESEQFKLGAQARKESILQKYQELTDSNEKQGTIALREDIIRLRDLYAKMMARF
jgi:hypothetical protein